MSIRKLDGYLLLLLLLAGWMACVTVRRYARTHESRVDGDRMEPCVEFGRVLGWWVFWGVGYYWWMGWDGMGFGIWIGYGGRF